MAEEPIEQKQQTTDQKVGGFGVGNLLNNTSFISSKSKVVTLSFDIRDIVEIDDSEILKLNFSNGFTVRIMKYDNELNQAVATFDIVDEEKREIITKSNKEYIRGLGISDTFYGMNMITQWEIPILTKLCLGFVHGDVEAIKDLIKNYHVKIDKKAEWNLRMKLGLD
jgi:hypothetical protein